MQSRSDALHRTPRLYVRDQLSEGRTVALGGKQANYLLHVLRLGKGSAFRLFNGENGEWLVEIVSLGKRDVTLRSERLLRAATPLPDIEYLFAPLKHIRIDYMAQKATELGVCRLRPVITRHTSVARVNVDRLRANVIEAAEQCNLVSLPEVVEPRDLGQVLSEWHDHRKLIYCDEAAQIANPLAALGAIERGPLAVLIGPEGGFAPEEQARLRALPFVTAISLGPRIMRADTAAIAALSLIQSVLGDWR